MSWWILALKQTSKPIFGRMPSALAKKLIAKMSTVNLGCVGCLHVLTIYICIYIYILIYIYTVLFYTLCIIYNLLYIYIIWYIQYIKLYYIYIINNVYIIYYIYGMFEIHEDTIHRERERDRLLIIFMIFMYPIVCLLIVCLYVFITIFWWWFICNYLWTHFSPSRSQHFVFAGHFGLAMHFDEDLDPAQSALPAPNCIIPQTIAIWHI